MISQRISFITQLFNSCYIYNNLFICIHPYRPILTADIKLPYCTYTSRSIPPPPHPRFPPVNHLQLDINQSTRHIHTTMVYFIAKRVLYAAHVIVLFTLAFSAFVLVYVQSSPTYFPHLINRKGGADWTRELTTRILCTFSSPFIRSINFLSIPSGGYAEAIRTTFGAFGWCAPDFCLPSAIGYE